MIMSSSSLRFLVAVVLLALLTPQKSSGQFHQWCVANDNVADSELQKALDWACWKNPEGCLMLQPNKPCFMPNTVKDHASYAFNSYYQKFKHQGATCTFNGAAHFTSTDPSHGSCNFECPP